MLVRKRLPYKTKMGIIAAVIGLLVLLYYIYKIEIYTWSCENENIPSSCMIVGMLNEEKGYLDTSENFYRKSCEMEYALGCDKLFLLYKRKGLKEQAEKASKAACDLGIKRHCASEERR